MHHFPLILGAAALVPTERVDRAGRPPGSPSSWVWPVRAWQEGPDQPTYRPIVSHEFVGRGLAGQHLGVDVMFRRRSADDLPQYKSGTHDASGAFVAPPGAFVCAAAAARVWSCSQHPLGRGWQIVLDHGSPYATYYLHMATVNIPIIGAGNPELHVEAGQLLGLMGYDPSAHDAQHLRHLHFELWIGGAEDHASDPQATNAPLGGIDKWSVLADPRWPQLAGGNVA